MWAKLVKILRLLGVVMLLLSDNRLAPIFIDSDNRIVDGHARFILAKSLGAKRVTVIRIESKPEEVDIESLIQLY